jgi:hypothetical protein
MKMRKIVGGIVEFVGGFAIGVVSLLACEALHNAVVKATEKEPDCIRDATGLDWADELPF